VPQSAVDPPELNPVLQPFLSLCTSALIRFHTEWPHFYHGVLLLSSFHSILEIMSQGCCDGFKPAQQLQVTNVTEDSPQQFRHLHLLYYTIQEEQRQTEKQQEKQLQRKQQALLWF
jgi:hypothetical protein